MTEEEKRILKVFIEVMSKLNEREKERLLWLGEGIALKTEQEEKKKQTA